MLCVNKIAKVNNSLSIGTILHCLALAKILGSLVYFLNGDPSAESS